VYACRNFTCSPPKHDMAEALSWAKTEPDAADEDPGADDDSPDPGVSY
jgi:hypothetical protein